MLGCYLYRPLRRLRHLGNFHCSAPDSASVFNVRASRAEKLEAPVPGTVKQYEQHVLIQAAPLKSDRAAQQSHAAHGIWWPSAVEKWVFIWRCDNSAAALTACACHFRHPAVIEALTAAVRNQGQQSNMQLTSCLCWLSKSCCCMCDVERAQVVHHINLYSALQGLSR